MHILGLLGTVVAVLYLLDRLGIDIGWLNPWAWRRRRAWAKKFDGDPIYALDDPMQIAAVLVVGTARLKGDLTSDQKAAILERFESEFSLSVNAATELLTSVTYLLGAPQVIRTQLDGVLSRNRQTFSAGQAESVIGMAEAICSLDGSPSSEQRDFVERLRAALSPAPPRGKWDKAT